MSRQKADNKEVANDIIYEKFLDVSDAVDNMSKLKDILKTEIALQQQILETSILLGFSFDINNDEVNEFDADAVFSEDELFQTYFENHCLEAENKVVTKLLNDIKRDYEELKSEEINENVTEELEDQRRESLSTSHQLKDDVIEGNVLICFHLIVQVNFRGKEQIQHSQKENNNEGKMLMPGANIVYGSWKLRCYIPKPKH